jgi:hypothetical protein
VESETAKVRRSVEWLTPLLHSSSGLTSSLHSQWKALQTRKALLDRYVDDAHTAHVAFQQRSAEYPHLQSLHSSLTHRTVPRHDEAVRRIFDAVNSMSSGDEAAEADDVVNAASEEAASSSPSPVLSYAAVAAALRQHQQRWTAVEADLEGAHQQLRERQWQLSAPN